MAELNTNRSYENNQGTSTIELKVLKSSCDDLQDGESRTKLGKFINFFKRARKKMTTEQPLTAETEDLDSLERFYLSESLHAFAYLHFLLVT
ncbi:hypothetical protein QE152_g2012 [Popillia japonica]|uniref:Uncharacterized protein n=1 Tax=Popillia japonica TaxID=7064 RepID=A0AAW1N0Z4_POPJA